MKELEEKEIVEQDTEKILKCFDLRVLDGMGAVCSLRSATDRCWLLSVRQRTALPPFPESLYLKKMSNELYMSKWPIRK